MFPHYAIADADLAEGVIPNVTDQWDRPLTRFALSFDGYSHASKELGTVPVTRLGAFVCQVIAAWVRDGVLPTTLSLADLRACLFWQQRRCHFAGTVAIPDRQRGHLCAILEAIRSKLIAQRCC